MLSLKFSVLTGAFGGSGVAIHSIDGISGERGLVFLGGDISSSTPTVGLEDTGDIHLVHDK